MQDYQTLEFSVDQHVAVIRLNRPDSANGISILLAHELMLVTNFCLEQSDIRAVLLTGNGKMFCAGGDLKEFASFGDNAPEKISELLLYLHASIHNIAHMEKPVVIAVNGMAAGAGFSLACCGDIVYAAESAKFTMAYTAIGLSPDGGASFHLPRLIGIRRTQELMLTNRKLSAQEALDWGIVTKLFAEADLLEEAMNLAFQLANGPTKAYIKVKELLLNSSQNDLDSQMELEAKGMSELSNTVDGKNGIIAFVEKKSPIFTGN